MNLYRLAVIALRVWSIDLMLTGALNVFNLPVGVLDLLNATDAYRQQWYMVRLGGSIVSSVIHLGVGIYLMDHPERIAAFAARSISRAVTYIAPSTSVWPPAPILPAEPDPAAGPLGPISLFHLAVVLLRIDGMSWLFGAVFFVQDFAMEGIGLAHNASGYWHGMYLLELCLDGLHCVCTAGSGLYLLLIPDSLAKRITLDLIHAAEMESHTPAPPPERVEDAGANSVR